MEVAAARERMARVHAELQAQCAHRFDDFVCHAAIHPEFHDVAWWKARGYCSVYCQASNWAHSCDFTLCCNADREFCRCATPCPLCRGPVTARDAGVFVDATCPRVLGGRVTRDAVAPVRPRAVRPLHMHDICVKVNLQLISERRVQHGFCNKSNVHF